MSLVTSTPTNQTKADVSAHSKSAFRMLHGQLVASRTAGRTGTLFLNSVWDGFHITGSGYKAQSPTVLHVAASNGHLDQIPKDFFTPEFLLIEATGYRQTVLELIVKNKRLDLLPANYADSELWYVKSSSGATPREILEQLIEGEAQVEIWQTEREQRERERAAWRPPRFTGPIQTDPSKLLPVFSDASLCSIEVKSSDRTKTYIVNLLDYNCTCPLCLDTHSGVPPRDFGRLCKHIIIALRERSLVAQLPPIAKGIVENGFPEAFGVYPGRFAEDLYGRPVYITGKNYDGWINVFALLRRNGVNYSRFGYNVNSRRWFFKNLSYLYLPKIDESILY